MRYIGEFCSTDMPYCNAGVCNKSNLCELVPYGKLIVCFIVLYQFSIYYCVVVNDSVAGGGCSQDSDCDPKLYCGGSDTCIQVLIYTPPLHSSPYLLSPPPFLPVFN